LRHRRARSAAAGPQAEVLRDDIRGGAAAGDRRGLRAAARAGLDRAFVSAVDMPYLSVDLIDEAGGLRQCRHRHRASWDGRDHYLAGIYRRLAERIDALVAAGERSMHAR
jgi:molybdopterin-guanine dinucleotide biosynthesis protein A